MKFFYPVIVKQEASDRYHAVFPDLACCEAGGSSLEDVLDRATDAAYGWIDVELQEDEPDLPSATDPVDLTLSDGESVHMILVNYKFTDGWDE